MSSSSQGRIESLLTNTTFLIVVAIVLTVGLIIYAIVAFLIIPYEVGNHEKAVRILAQAEPYIIHKGEVPYASKYDLPNTLVLRGQSNDDGFWRTIGMLEEYPLYYRATMKPTEYNGTVYVIMK